MVDYDVTQGRPRLADWFGRVRAECQPVYDEVHQMCYKIRAKFGGKAKL